ncbi:hypothetical protein NEOLEDRAFT_1146772 [Neolentinus lepideus HHB14362 ss-1]|uniref:Transcription factor domain-containing protein n=1 Tax=Neolentinus lepideus HHB14362 ss-1 TaxID=1314782 RepID=A0A165TW01_9AGAM|nr:hypothetical protein NEOLEDRAFT_1146772 [Neolentinus lepideus HHB14362 ss-1]
MVSSNLLAWNMVELLLQDDLARDVLSSVNTGPFGPGDRAALSPSATIDEIFSYVINNHSRAASSNRPEKQSRVSRETMSNAKEEVGDVNVDEVTDTFGRLSMDENQEHGYPKEEDIDVPMPPRKQQEHLVEAYFTCIHPCFPLINKQQFLEQFRAGTKTFSKALLFSVLAIAERYNTSREPAPPKGVMSEAGCEFTVIAHEILGSTEQAWLYTGMAIHMFKGSNLFSDSDKWVRRAVWWTLCIVDRL